MQLRSFGRLRVIRRIVGFGKEIMESRTGGGGVANWVEDMVSWVREELWKTRTGQGVLERM